MHEIWDRLEHGRAAYIAKHDLRAWIGQERTTDETDGFFRTLDTGLARISDDEQAIELIGFPPPGDPKRWRLYGHWQDSAYWSWREMFVQLAFAGELVDSGWPAEQVHLEAGLDVGVYPDQESPCLLAEAKTAARDLGNRLGSVAPVLSCPLVLVAPLRACHSHVPADLIAIG